MAAEAVDTAAHGAEGAAFPPFDLTLYPSQIFWFAVSFGLLYFVMARFVLPKVSGVVETREVTVKGDLDAAAVNSAEADKTRAASDEAIAKARAEGRATVERRRAEVQAELNAEQEKADKAIADRIAAAEARIGAARAKALAEVDGLANELAASIVAKIAPDTGAKRRSA
ncbi:MAG TPA: hypothetical protein VG841_01880 [Caulobacterales bacterium]|nr:hypothetical protein [Caulobacterales bacterium]